MEYTKRVLELESEIFSCLANPKRLEILHLLIHRPLSVGQIVEMTDIAQANVSQHLTILKRLGLVNSKKEAQARVYSLSSKHISSAFKSVRNALLDRYGLEKIDQLNKIKIFIDPICGMRISSQSAVATHTLNGQKYYFCASGCEKKFRRQSQAHEVKNAVIAS